MAYDLVEQRMRDGTASAQEVTNFLKLGSTREQLEQQKLSYENELTRVKIKAAEDAQRMEAVYTEALNAMRSYSGHEVIDDDDPENV